VAAASNCYSVRLDFLGDVAQLVERGLCKPEVVGSIPIVSTNFCARILYKSATYVASPYMPHHSTGLRHMGDSGSGTSPGVAPRGLSPREGPYRILDGLITDEQIIEALGAILEWTDGCEHCALKLRRKIVSARRNLALAQRS
jgi:hypothetical protein